MPPQPVPEPENLQAHILLVEDDVLIRSLVAEELRSADLCVVETANADEAWRYLQAGGAVDLMFSDIHMPGSMDGLELARRVKIHYPGIKLIITSGNAGPRSIADIGILLPKPYQLERAAQLTLQILGVHKAHPAP